jgi:hypothetical protein
VALLRGALSLKTISYGPKLQLGFYDKSAPLDLHQKRTFLPETDKGSKNVTSCSLRGGSFRSPKSVSRCSAISARRRNDSSLRVWFRPILITDPGGS